MHLIIKKKVVYIHYIIKIGNVLIDVELAESNFFHLIKNNVFNYKILDLQWNFNHLLEKISLS